MKIKKVIIPLLTIAALVTAFMFAGCSCSRQKKEKDIRVHLNDSLTNAL
jgi:hypothetical protein